MTAPNILYCVGATKAGTSWLYRYLHDHPDCAMPAVKEAHYWDTFDADVRERQLVNFRVRLRELRADKVTAADEGRNWQVENLDRRINEMKSLTQVIEGPRDDDSAYRNWLLGDRSGAKLVGDMTPNYATVDDETLVRMRDAHPSSKFLFLIRDPLDRLWSHIRMQARRQRQAHEVYEKKSNNILHRMLNRGQETHILERGDYPTIIRKLRRVIPEGRLLVQFIEDVWTTAGLEKLCAFLGVSAVTPENEPVHEGSEVIMRDRLRPRALGLLNEHYDWVARNVGPLPQRWQDNLARA